MLSRFWRRGAAATAGRSGTASASRNGTASANRNGITVVSKKESSSSLFSGGLQNSCKDQTISQDIFTRKYSVYVDSHLDSLETERKKTLHRKNRSREFDTLGTWDTRLDVQINETASMKTGTVVPDIDLNLIGTFTNQGRRTYQEDRFVVKRLQPDLVYCAVFDGHGGSKCAEYCQDHFHTYITHFLARETSISKVLEKSFYEVNKSFDRWFNSKKEHKNLQFSSGTTATVCLIQDNYMMYIGHCGDSRAILYRDNKARRLTRDHCATDPDEKKRIIDVGGNVTSDSIGRCLVNGRLCMSRSIGDLELKHQGVTCQPDIKQVKIKHGKDGFLVLTTDGINFVMQDQEVVDCINRCENAAEGAARLVDQALLYCCEDNATAIVIPFGSWGKGDTNSSMFYSFGRSMIGSSRFG
eukprot:TRINITY_DN19018_c0_g1_i5.p1 TRINITY_DN19018_c0_g1~~TRINITY_DN19018_c0_g1_i5.p1  ORF type:complete len:413 (-),score=80.83 TRINITY_DN19018_c0_g1_i5:191-1429(-)